VTFPPSDFAFRNYKKRHLWSETNKKRIDDKFYEDMMGVCYSKGPWKQFWCRSAARFYHACVRNFVRNKATDPEPGKDGKPNAGSAEEDGEAPA
jgi:hypothetical protein